MSMNDESDVSVMEAVTRLTKDLRNASVTLGRDEARFLVKCYYDMQENRIRAAAQVRGLVEDEKPHDVVAWYLAQAETMEREVKRALDAYSAADPLGEWARRQHGIGPVIAAGLLAHIDFEPWRCMAVRLGKNVDGKKPKKCRPESPHGSGCALERITTVGKIWRFAGLDPTTRKEKGKRLPWNADLKVLCWKMGESFVKVSGNEDAYYGQLYRQRKEQEEQRNAAGAFSEQARVSLETKEWKRPTEARKAYEAGQLPQARIHLRAQRWAVKMFLADYHVVGYRLKFNEEPPLPYPIAHLGHADLRKPPE